VCDLLWRPVGQLVRFVAVIHRPRGACLLMSTDLSLGAIDIIRIYGLRFKIEHMFRQAVHLIGSFAYHFWMMDTTPLRYRNGNQHLHRQSDRYREQIRRKIHAYHVFMQAGAIAQGLLQYLSVVFPRLVWDSFGSWLSWTLANFRAPETAISQAFRMFREFSYGSGRARDLSNIPVHPVFSGISLICPFENWPKSS
jgi:hypothetical protein